MPEFPDIHAWIKLIDQHNGRVVPSSSQLSHPSTVTIRYVVANDSNQSAGEIAVIGILYKNNVKVIPSPLPLTWIKLQASQLWKHEYTVISTGEENEFRTTLFGGVGGSITEEDEKNNIFGAKFSFLSN
ncbi:MAG TPA: hypothetical protein VE130_01715 [Nitrososphaeraceae archaeon]|jgi:hypothetical protein|nr:hypothetical protein [Nitrososphaeraceae archaeon]